MVRCRRTRCVRTAAELSSRFLLGLTDACTLDERILRKAAPYTRVRVSIGSRFTSIFVNDWLFTVGWIDCALNLLLPVVGSSELPRTSLSSLVMNDDAAPLSKAADDETTADSSVVKR